ncbi:hypothetical protein LLH00_13100 [bacterium]|nr:hypothetical protein [bacterium]
MQDNKKVIKADKVASGEVHVETVRLGMRRFHDKVFRDLPEEGRVELGEAPYARDAAEDGHGAGGEVEVQKTYDDRGVLQSVRLVCRCGEVIELEFSEE